MDGPAVADIQALGMTHHAIPMTRAASIRCGAGHLLALIRLFRRLRPQVVHLVTIKPVLYGGIAARLARCRAWSRRFPAWGSCSCRTR